MWQTRCLSPFKFAISQAPGSIPTFTSKWSRFSMTSSRRQWDFLRSLVVSLLSPRLSVCYTIYCARAPRQNYLRAAIILRQAAKRLSVPTYTCYICYWYNVRTQFWYFMYRARYKINLYYHIYIPRNTLYTSDVRKFHTLFDTLWLPSTGCSLIR